MKRTEKAKGIYYLPFYKGIYKSICLCLNENKH